MVLDFFRINIPQILCTSKKLVSLKLSSYIALNGPEFVNLPSLKVLHLRFPSCPSWTHTNRIVSGCPVLEDLDIGIGSQSESDLNGNQTLSILSSSLRQFEFTNVLSNGDVYTLIVNAPQLKFLYLKDSFSLKPQIEIKNFSSIRIATFDFIYCGDGLLEHCRLRMAPIVDKFKIDVLAWVSSPYLRLY